MNYFVTDICNKNYSKKCLSDIFGNGKAPSDKVFVITCTSGPIGYYPSYVSFTTGIDYQLITFIQDNHGISSIEFDDMSFTITAVCKHLANKADKRFNSFVDALGYAMVEDRRFWNEETLHKDNDSLLMTNKH